MEIPTTKTLYVSDPVTCASKEFIVGASLDFKDVTDELYREFVFPGGDVVRVDAPALINVKAPPNGRRPGGGSLRIIHLDGSVTYIPYGWIALRWFPRPGRATVAF